jgi:hypothetical protein
MLELKGPCTEFCAIKIYRCGRRRRGWRGHCAFLHARWLAPPEFANAGVCRCALNVSCCVYARPVPAEGRHRTRIERARTVIMAGGALDAVVVWRATAHKASMVGVGACGPVAAWAAAAAGGGRGGGRHGCGGQCCCSEHEHVRAFREANMRRQRVVSRS